MTHFHISILGQCLISLARQGIKSPLNRVLRFIQAGAVVPTPPYQCSSSPQEKIKSNLTQDKVTQCIAKPSLSKVTKNSIQSGIIKVSFSKAQDLLKYINLISSQQSSIDSTKQYSQKQQQQYLNIQQQQKEQLQDQIPDLNLVSLMEPSQGQQRIEEQTSQSLQDLTELAKNLEFAAGNNELFRQDLNILIENVFLEKRTYPTVKPQVNENSNLLQLRYAPSFPFLLSDIYNMSIGYLTIKTENSIQEVNDSFLRSYTIGDLMRNSQQAHSTSFLIDIVMSVPLPDLVENFNAQVLKREPFTKEMHVAIRELALSIIEEIEEDEPDSIY